MIGDGQCYFTMRYPPLEPFDRGPSAVEQVILSIIAPDQTATPYQIAWIRELADPGYGLQCFCEVDLGFGPLPRSQQRENHQYLSYIFHKTQVALVVMVDFMDCLAGIYEHRLPQNGLHIIQSAVNEGFWLTDHTSPSGSTLKI